MSKTNSWYVITGGPSSGKTTLLAELAKLGHETFPEAARVLIDEALAKGISVEKLRADEKRFQQDAAQLKATFEAETAQDVLTFFDRGMHDTWAYLKYYDFKIENWIEELMKSSRYQKVFLLEPLATYEKDYARTEDDSFVDDIHQLLHDAYAKFGMTPILVPAMSVPDRVRFVLDHTKQGQTA